MSNEQMSLDAAATERKARLARLALLKRKREDPNADGTQQVGTEPGSDSQASETNKYISGRNFDISASGPKLGFEQQPISKNGTVEDAAARLVIAANAQAAKDEIEAEKGIDLFKLQPKKPNWDLKRDLNERMKTVDVRTQNAIARLVRERIDKAKKEALESQASLQSLQSEDENGQELGVEGNTLVQAVHMREKEDEQEREEEAQDEEDNIS